jgi:hypothetical protein
MPTPGIFPIHYQLMQVAPKELWYPRNSSAPNMLYRKYCFGLEHELTAETVQI